MNRKYVVSETEVGRFAYFLSHLSLLHLVAAYVVTKLAGAALVAEQEMGVQEFCETELFNATCGPTEVILMTHAQYGRMRMGRCVKLDYGHMGCASDVIEQTDGRCSGRRQCEIRIPDALFAETLPCPDDLKPYLEASFRCVKVHTPKSDTCTNRDLIIKDSEGYLSNLVSQQTGCGTVHNPWLVRVQSGQTVRIRLLDFAVSKRREGLYPYTQCQIYGEIKERLTSGLRNTTVCGANVRDHVVYTSVSNSVEISLKTGSGEDPAITPYYLFKYEAVGCPDRVLPVGSYGVRQGDGLVVRCNFTNDVFHLKCVGTVWVGELRNCTTTSRKVHISSGGEDLGIPYGLSILIVLAIALVIGLFVLFTGLAFLKKQTERPVFV